MRFCYLASGCVVAASAVQVAGAPAHNPQDRHLHVHHPSKFDFGDGTASVAIYDDGMEGRATGMGVLIPQVIVTLLQQIVGAEMNVQLMAVSAILIGVGGTLFVQDFWSTFIDPLLKNPPSGVRMKSSTSPSSSSSSPGSSSVTSSKSGEVAIEKTAEVGTIYYSLSKRFEDVQDYYALRADPRLKIFVENINKTVAVQELESGVAEEGHMLEIQQEYTQELLYQLSLLWTSQQKEMFVLGLENLGLEGKLSAREEALLTEAVDAADRESTSGPTASVSRNTTEALD